MIFPFILVIIFNGDPLPWAGFQTQDACEQVRAHLRIPKGAIATCAKTVQT
jgi:hypothetical protein